jgi:hypothetical protein
MLLSSFDTLKVFVEVDIWIVLPFNEEMYYPQNEPFWMCGGLIVW